MRSLAIVCAVILAAPSAACAPAFSPPPFSDDSRPLSACAADASGRTFAATVKYLAQTGYDPMSFGTPPADTTAQIPSNISGDIQAAFQRSPPFFRRLLCDKLSGVYIDRTAGRPSWGFRDPQHTDNKYIGLSSVLWTGSSLTLHDFETRRIRALLQSNAPYYGPAQPDDSSGVAILAALAHEYGHILWYDLFKPGGMYTGNWAANFCSGQFFNSWEEVTLPGSWVDFGEIKPLENQHTDDPSSDNVSVADIAAARGNDSGLRPLLTSLYDTKGRWASAFAAFSPTEDFVETLELAVLMIGNSSFPGLTSLPLYFNQAGVVVKIGDIPKTANGKHTKFLKKRACI